MYFPQINHPAFGIIRAIVKDSSAVQSNLPANQSFLDTDGRVAQLTRPDPSNPAVQEGSYLLQVVMTFNLNSFAIDPMLRILLIPHLIQSYSVSVVGNLCIHL